MNGPAGLHSLDHAKDFLSAASWPNFLTQSFELVQVDGAPAFVRGMQHHSREIHRVLHAGVHFPRQREHGPIFVRQGGFQGRDAIANAMLSILRPHRMGQGFLLVRPVRTGNVDDGSGLTGDKEEVVSPVKVRTSSWG